MNSILIDDNTAIWLNHNLCLTIYTLHLDRQSAIRWCYFIIVGLRTNRTEQQNTSNTIFCFIFILLLGWNYYLSMTQQQYSRRSSFCYCSVQQKSLLNEKKPKSPDITSRLLKFLNVSAVCVFYVVMICSFLKINSFSGCKIKTNIDINQINLDFLCKKPRKRLQFLRTKKTLCELLWLKYSCAFCVFWIFSATLIKKLKYWCYILFSLYFTLSLHYLFTLLYI